MKNRFHNFFVSILLLCIASCSGQNKTNIPEKKSNKNTIVGGPFENGEFMYYGMPETISAVDTSAAWHLDGQKLMIQGRMFREDGKTPAPNVILYYYQTDTAGYYSDQESLDPRAKRHGHIRGWVKSDDQGNYTIYTIRPAPYPNLKEPAHIHISVKEPNIEKEYYLDALVFDDDRLLTTDKRKALTNRGGSGILRTMKRNGLQVAEHNIILGLNIPNYPQTKKADIFSGISIGEDVLSFTPFHAWGPDRGTKTCPVCKYGKRQGILYFVGRYPDWLAIKKWLRFFEDESSKRKKGLKVYFVYGNDMDYNKTDHIKLLESLGEELTLEHVALTFVPSFSDTDSEIDFIEINPEVKSTLIIYKNSNVVDKYINLEPDPTNFTLISRRLNETTGIFWGNN